MNENSTNLDERLITWAENNYNDVFKINTKEDESLFIEFCKILDKKSKRYNESARQNEHQLKYVFSYTIKNLKKNEGSIHIKTPFTISDDEATDSIFDSGHLLSDFITRDLSGFFFRKLREATISEQPEKTSHDTFSGMFGLDHTILNTQVRMKEFIFQISNNHLFIVVNFYADNIIGKEKDFHTTMPINSLLLDVISETSNTNSVGSILADSGDEDNNEEEIARNVDKLNF